MPVSQQKTQLVVIGGGPGGYAAAFYAADMGMEVTLVDLEQNPGGVCLYRGCIPSKALLHVSKLLAEVEEAKKWGIEFEKPKIDFQKLNSWKDSVVTKLTTGLGQLSKARKVTFIQGRASFKDSQTLTIMTEGHNDDVELKFDKAIIAAGSRPATVPGFPLESKYIVDSTGALNVSEVPDKLLVIGGGYIGLELGSVYASLGAQVDVVEMMDDIMMGADKDLSQVLKKNLKTKFNNIMVKTKVTGVEEESDGVKVTFSGEGAKEPVAFYNKVLVSIGRKPNSSGLGLDHTNVKTNERGFIEIKDNCQTDDENIFAIGDIVGGMMLAHKASHEAKVAVDAARGKRVAFQPQAIPCVVFTDPEVAWCGLTEKEAKEKDLSYDVAKFPWAASGRATSIDRNDGLTKLIIDKETDRILGVGMVGVGAGDMIAEGVLAIEMGATVQDLALTIHPHPTLSETVMEAAEMQLGHCTHMYRPKRK